MIYLYLSTIAYILGLYSFPCHLRPNITSCTIRPSMTFNDLLQYGRMRVFFPLSVLTKSKYRRFFSMLKFVISLGMFSCIALPFWVQVGDVQIAHRQTSVIISSPREAKLLYGRWDMQKKRLIVTISSESSRMFLMLLPSLSKLPLPSTCYSSPENKPLI